jgi:hypothetical protein
MSRGALVVICLRRLAVKGLLSAAVSGDLTKTCRYRAPYDLPVAMTEIT